MPVSCLGALDTGATVKTMKINHCCQLNAGDNQLQRWREQVKVFLSDKGAERKVVKAPKLDAPPPRLCVQHYGPTGLR